MSADSRKCVDGASRDAGSGLVFGGAIGLLVGLLTGQAAMVILIGAGVGLIFGPGDFDDTEGW